MVLFWAMFLPLGLVRSTDEALAPEGSPGPPRRIFTIATIALMAQVVMMYWSAVLYKTGPEWHQEGNAVWYALSLEQMATPLGHWLLNFPKLLHFLTFFTIATEAAAPIFLFIPFLSGQIRTTGVLFLFCLHLGFASCMYLGHFPFVAAVMLTPLLPTYFWEQITRERGKHSRLRLFYDGDCGFCRRSVLIIRALLLHSEDQILISQDDARANAILRERRSWAVQNARGEYFAETAAMAEVFRHSPVMWPFAWALRAKPIEIVGNKIYHVIERHRSELSRWTAIFKYRPLSWQISAFGQVLVVFFLILALWWNVQNQVPRAKMPQNLDSVALSFRIDQYWDMFSPSPLREDGWYVIEGTLKNDQRVDLWRDGAAVSFERRPASEVRAQYKNERWRKYMMNLYADRYAMFRLYFDRYLCRQWNQYRSMDDPRLLETFNVYFMMHTTQPPGAPEEPYRRVLVAQHYCWK
jgi:predicted DCC family thiol-disulfide oxidoreductase YuxK